MKPLNQGAAAKVVLVDDHILFRDFVRKLCVQDLKLDIVGEATTAMEAEEVIAEKVPNLVILDLHLPDRNGFTVLQFIREKVPSVRVLVLTARCDDYTLFQIEKNSVDGFVDKCTANTEILREAIRALQNGCSFYSPILNEMRLMRVRSRDDFAKILSEKECAVLSLIGEALSDEEIAATLGLRTMTVQSYRSVIIRKLNLNGTPKLIRYAIEHGFTYVNSPRRHFPTESSTKTRQFLESAN